MALLKGWCAWGLAPSEFWEQTAESYRAIIAGRQQADQHELERGVILAWMGENMARQPKGLKPPRHWLAMVRPKKQQSSADVLAMFRNFKAQGIPVQIRKIGKEGKE